MLKRIWCWLTLNHIDPGVAPMLTHKGVRWCCKRCKAPMSDDPHWKSDSIARKAVKRVANSSSSR